MAHYVSIFNAWGSPRFHCPACGHTVFTADGEPTDKPCEHLLFSLINEVGEFYNPAEEIKELIANGEEWCSVADEKFLARCPETAVLFGLEFEGMACGPVSMTVVHAIKFPELNLD